MKHLDLKQMVVSELGMDEITEINGGDRFMSDLGYCFGYACGAMWSFLMMAGNGQVAMLRNGY